MASRSFLDALKSNSVESSSSLLKQAEAAIRKDDFKELRRLLASEGHEGVKETDDCDQVSGNCLHLSVRHLAALCIHLMVNPPYNWDPQRPNGMGLTPLTLALRHERPYLPVIWPLAMASTKPLDEEYLVATTLPRVLLRPTKNPLSFNEVHLICSSYRDDPEYTRNTVELLFELLRCSQPLADFDVSTIRPQKCQRCLSPLENSEEQTCLTNIDTPDVLKESYACWLERRFAEGPLSLMECCRSFIRRQIMHNIKPEGPSDYAQALASLKLPPRLLAFLSFRELWPVLQDSHKFDFRRGRVTAPRHPLVFIDPIPPGDDILYFADS